MIIEIMEFSQKIMKFSQKIMEFSLHVSPRMMMFSLFFPPEHLVGFIINMQLSYNTISGFLCFNSKTSQ